MLIDPLAAFLDGLLHRAGVFLRETSEGSGQNGCPLCLADGLQPPDKIGGRFQFVWRQRFQILDDGFETARNFKLPRYGQAGKRARFQSKIESLPNSIHRLMPEYDAIIIGGGVHRGGLSPGMRTGLRPLLR